MIKAHRGQSRFKGRESVPGWGWKASLVAVFTGADAVDEAVSLQRGGRHRRPACFPARCLSHVLSQSAAPHGCRQWRRLAPSPPLHPCPYVGTVASPPTSLTQDEAASGPSPEGCVDFLHFLPYLVLQQICSKILNSPILYKVCIYHSLHSIPSPMNAPLSILEKMADS